MTIPTWLEFTLLALAAFRLTRLVGYDDLTVPLRTRLLGVSDTEHHELATDIDAALNNGDDPWDAWPSPPPISRRRYYVSKLVHCPWCAGFWVSLVVWGVWLAWPVEVVWACVPLALSAVVGLVSKQWDA